MSDYKRRRKEHDFDGYFDGEREVSYSRDFNTNFNTDIKKPKTAMQLYNEQQQQIIQFRENDPHRIRTKQLLKLGEEMLARKEADKEEKKHEYMPWYNNTEDREKLKSDIIASYKQASYKNASGETIFYSISKIGNATLIMGSGVSKDDLEKTDIKTFEVLRDLVNDNDITEITVSSFYRTPEESGKVKGSSKKSPHTQGRGIDITHVSAREEMDIISEAIDIRGENDRDEPDLIAKITNWAKSDKRISQVFSPWRIIKDGDDNENKYYEDKSFRDDLHYPHRHHMHLSIIIK